MKNVFIFYLCWLSLPAFSSDSTESDPHSSALGRIQALSESFPNPSALSFYQVPAAGISVMNHFEIKELNTLSGYVIFPNKWLDSGFRMSSSGIEDYRKWLIQGGFSKKIHPKLSIGAILHYEKISSAGDEEIDPVVGFDIGLTFQMNPHFRWALLVKNAADNSKENTTSIHAGVDYSISTACDFLLEGGAGIDGSTRFSAGINYELADRFYIRTGLYSEPLTPTFGLAVARGNLILDISCDKHASLGYSTGIGLSYQF